LQGEVSEPRFCVARKHLAVFHLGFLSDPAIDVKDILRSVRLFYLSLNELDCP
jgi:hypothetical protein